MQRTIALVVLLGFGQVVAASTPVSWMLDVPVGQTVDVVQVGPTGFVVTDVWTVGTSTGVLVTMFEDASLKYQIQFYSGVMHEHAMTTGIVFAPGTTVRIEHSSNPLLIGISGYIPTANAGVPAVSTWGLVVMVGLLGVAATVMIRRGAPVPA